MKVRQLWVVALMTMVSSAGCFGGDDGDEDEHSHGTYTCADGTVIDLSTLDHHDDDGDAMAADEDDAMTGNETGNGTLLLGPSLLPSMGLQANETGNGTTDDAMDSNETGDDGQAALTSVQAGPSAGADPALVAIAMAMCPGGGGSGGSGGSGGTTNLPPVMVINITDIDGNPTNVVLNDQNMTFDATGSFDPDGSLEAVAVVITDRNTTRFASLYSAGAFTPASFVMETPGVVNVTVSLIDDKGAITAEQFDVYVNHVQSAGAFSFLLAEPTGLILDATACSAFENADVAFNQIRRPFNFDTFENATAVEAVVDSGTVEIAICDPSGAAISEGGGSSVYAVGDFPRSRDYYVFVVSRTPLLNDYVGHVIVHYEPQDTGDEEEA